MVYLKIIATIALIVSIAWVIAKPSFESALAVAVSMSALVSAFLIQKRTSKRTQQNQSISKSSIGIQAGRDVIIGNIGNHRDNKKGPRTNDHPYTQIKGNHERSVDTHEERLKRARYHVETRLKKRKGRRASFEAIRKEVDETYTDEFLKELIELNPEIFGRCTLKKGNKPGITLA
jgi:hypothetical protein